jgi:hypothetical protein
MLLLTCLALPLLLAGHACVNSPASCQRLALACANRPHPDLSQPTNTACGIWKKGAHAASSGRHRVNPTGIYTRRQSNYHHSNATIVTNNPASCRKKSLGCVILPPTPMAPLLPQQSQSVTQPSLLPKCSSSRAVGVPDWVVGQLSHVDTKTRAVGQRPLLITQGNPTASRGRHRAVRNKPVAPNPKAPVLPQQKAGKQKETIGARHIPNPAEARG